jgi:aromatic ring-opening dioxygenase LigB subunit
LLLKIAADLVNDALSCGYTGLVMLHGMLSEAGLKIWRSKVLVNGHPTYYGMAVAILKR